MTGVSRSTSCRRQVACALFLVACALFGAPDFSSATTITPGAPWAENFSTLGDGWDGPGLGSATLTYYFGALTSDLSSATVKSALQEAMDVWASIAAVTFTETPTASLLQSIDFHFVTGNHGDGYPFDGPSGVLAHAFYPAPPNPESIAGDVHFDDAEVWEIGNELGSTAFDLEYIAVHEIGHALGLGHSSTSGSVMYASVNSGTVFTGLHQDDIDGILSLYAQAAPAPVPEPATILLLGSGLAGIGVWSRKRFRRREFSERF